MGQWFLAVRVPKTGARNPTGGARALILGETSPQKMLINKSQAEDNTRQLSQSLEQSPGGWVAGCLYPWAHRYSRMEPAISTSSKFLNDTNAAGLGTTFRELQHR